MIKYLSHPISLKLPVYGALNKSIEFRPIKSIANGDSCNVYWFGMENHWGTHVDCPAHFFSKAKGILGYKADFWFFHHPQIINIKAKPNQIISCRDFVSKVKEETDLLILKSGWTKLRGKKIYSFENPVIDPSVGLWLRKKYPLLRAIGLDWISISSCKNRYLGGQVHRAFLNPKAAGNPILVIEDMNIPVDLDDLTHVWVAPLIIERADSAPCTVIGFTP